MNATPPKPPSATRTQRLAAALKRNIARRKQAAKPNRKK